MYFKWSGALAVFAFTLSFSATAVCAEPLAEAMSEPLAEPLDRGIGIYFDQDLLVPVFNEDRDYTMGLAFEFFWEKEKGLYPFDGLVEMASDLVDIVDKDKDIIYSFMLGVIAYTPDNLGNREPILDDRPYSSLIYLSNKRVRADKENAVAAEVLIGFLGTNITKSAQTRLHTYYRSATGEDEPVNPLGWSHQISDGGELTMRLRLTHSRLLSPPPQDTNYDVAATWGASLGFQTNVNVGVAIRAGNIKSPFWSLPYDPVTRGNFVPSRSKSEWFFWSAVRTHLVGYDALLQGQVRNSDVTYASNEIERFVYDGAIGFTVGFDEVQLTFSTNAKSSDLKNTGRKQVWGSVICVVHF